MRTIPLRVLCVTAALASASLACSIGLGGPTPPASPIAISTDAAGELEVIITQAIGNSQNGEVTVVITEQQLTSFVALKMAEDPEAPIKDVQVFLRDGQIIIFGTATIKNLTAPAEIRLDVTTNADGELDLKVAQADFGPVPVPATMLDAISTGLDEALSGQFGPQATGVKLTNVIVSDGQMTITGTATQ